MPGDDVNLRRSFGWLTKPQPVDGIGLQRGSGFLGNNIRDPGCVRHSGERVSDDEVLEIHNASVASSNLRRAVILGALSMMGGV